MIDSEDKPRSKYRVNFDREVAYGIVYVDAGGRLDFVFEAGKKPKSLFLDRRALNENKLVDPVDPATRARVELALARTKEFLSNKGYDVEIF